MGLAGLPTAALTRPKSRCWTLLLSGSPGDDSSFKFIQATWRLHFLELIGLEEFPLFSCWLSARVHFLLLRAAHIPSHIVPLLYPNQQPHTESFSHFRSLWLLFCYHQKQDLGFEGFIWLQWAYLDNPVDSPYFKVNCAISHNIIMGVICSHNLRFQGLGWDRTSLDGQCRSSMYPTD